MRIILILSLLVVLFLGWSLKLPDAVQQSSVPTPQNDSPPTRNDPARIRSATARFSTLPLAPTTEQRFRSECEARLAPTDILVTAQDAPITEVNNESIRTLTAQPNYLSPLPPRTLVLGLTSSSYSLHWATSFSSLISGDRQLTCSRPKVRVVLSEPYLKVSVAQEFKPGTCLYDVVRTHEFRHVRVDQEGLARSRDALQRELESHFGNTVFYGSSDLLQRQIAEAVSTYWIPRAQALYSEVQKKQHEIDTPEEYARNNVVCDHALAGVLEQNGY